MSRFEKIAKKLDLDSHISALRAYFARDKSIVLQGDRAVHAKFIKEIDSFEMPALPELENMDDLLMRLEKEATLKLDSIYLFLKIVIFFNRLKAQTLPPLWSQLVSKIEIPSQIAEIVGKFNDEGRLDSAQIEELYDVEQALKHISADKKERLRSIANSSSLSDFLVDTQVHLYYGQETLLVRGGFSKVLKASVVGRSSGGFFYIVPNSLEKLKERESQLLDMQEQIFNRYAKEYSAIFAKWVRFLRFINSEFDRVDHYFARAKMLKSKDLNLVLPNSDKKVVLKDFRHPALSDPKPIDIEFANKIMLITGVNAGGKTMLLKSILSAVFMSKYLLPISCNPNGTQIGSFANIEAILDDPQSVKNDISTFAGRMVEFRKLFKLKDAIVGVDEIELGTDADEAAALFRSLLETLSKKDIYFVVTTHHKRLASLMAKDRDVDLIAAIYDEQKQEPTYTYLSGSIGKSYAFETALRYGIDKDVVARAREYLGEDKEQLSELIEKSTQLEITMRQKIEQANIKLEDAKMQEQKLLRLKDRLKDEHQKRLNALEAEYRDSIKLVQKALKVAENPEARRLLNSAHKSKQKAASKEPKESFVELKAGDIVRYRGKRANVLSVRSKEIFIELEDGIKLRVSRGDLSKDSIPKKAKNKKPKVQVNVAKPSSAKLTLKLLGKRANEAEEEVQDFISKALLQGFSEVEIIHGTGTGVLVKVVSELLKKHPKVKNFERVKGNLGATIVKL